MTPQSGVISEGKLAISCYLITTLLVHINNLDLNKVIKHFNVHAVNVDFWRFPIDQSGSAGAGTSILLGVLATNRSWSHSNASGI